MQLNLFENQENFTPAPRLSTFRTFTLKVVKEKSAKYQIEKQVSEPKIVFEIATEILELDTQPEESFWLVTLDIKNNVTGLFEVSRGVLNSSLVHPREVFKRAILQNAASIIVMHNHPSGDPAPSKDDIEITKRLCEAGKLLGIQLFDHIIIGDSQFASLKEKGLF